MAPGNHQERNVQAGFLQNPQRRGTVELGHLVIGNHHVPFPFRQCPPHFPGIFHPPGLYPIPRPLHVAHDQRRVALRILDL